MGFNEEEEKDEESDWPRLIGKNKIERTEAEK